MMLALLLLIWSESVVVLRVVVNQELRVISISLKRPLLGNGYALIMRLVLVIVLAAVFLLPCGVMLLLIVRFVVRKASIGLDRIPRGWAINHVDA